MRPLVYHMIIPAVAPSVFFVIAFMPVDVFGCRTRGLMAFCIVLISGLAALGAAIKGAKGRMHGDTNAPWWVVSTLILVIPVIALIILA